MTIVLCLYSLLGKIILYLYMYNRHYNKLLDLAKLDNYYSKLINRNILVLQY